MANLRVSLPVILVLVSLAIMNSLGSHTTPEWFKDAKFGIYTHWGAYSVAAKGPNGSWYPHNMYKKGTDQYEYHLEHFGDPSEVGYKGPERPCEHACVFKIKRNKLYLNKELL